MKRFAKLTLVATVFAHICATIVEAEEYDNTRFDIYRFEDGSHSFYLVDTIQIPDPIIVKVEPHYMYFITTMETLLNYKGEGEAYFLQQDNAYLLMDFYTEPTNSSNSYKQLSKHKPRKRQSYYLSLQGEDIYEIDKPNELMNGDKIYAYYRLDKKFNIFQLFLMRGGLFNYSNSLWIFCPPRQDEYKQNEALNTKYYYRVVVPATPIN